MAGIAAQPLTETGPPALPERADVHWRPLVDERRLRRLQLLWLATTAAHVVPFVGVAALLLWLEPLTLPVALMSLAHAWVIPMLYAQRGANVVKRRTQRATPAAQATALGLLGDLLGHDARELATRTGLVCEPGRLGTWLVGPHGALLVRRRGSVVHCFCVRVPDPELPDGDRIAHLVLALRSDEQGFATVANQAFAGRPGRIRSRLDRRQRPALARAVAAERVRG